MPFAYIDRIRKLIDKVEAEETGNIQKCVSLLTETILEHRSIYIFGASHAGILSQEAFYRAGGLIPINPIFAPEVSVDREPITLTSKMERLEGYGKTLGEACHFRSQDVLIVHSVSGRNPVTIEIAQCAKEAGASVIGITNLAYSKSVSSRHSSGKKMYDFCDIILDNHGDIGDACVSVPGIQQKAGPTSTVIGALLLNTVFSETAAALAESGKADPVPVFYSANLDGGDEANRKLFGQYQSSIHYKF